MDRCPKCDAWRDECQPFCTDCGEALAAGPSGIAPAASGGSADESADAFLGMCREIWQDRFINPHELDLIDRYPLPRDEKVRIAALAGIPAFMLAESPASDLFELEHEALPPAVGDSRIYLASRLRVHERIRAIAGAGDFRAVRFSFVCSQPAEKRSVHRASIDLDHEALEHKSHECWDYGRRDQVWSYRIPLELPGPGEHHVYVVVWCEFSEGHFAFVSKDAIRVVVEDARRGNTYNVEHVSLGQGGVYSRSQYGASAGGRPAPDSPLIRIEFKSDRGRNKQWRPAPVLVGSPNGVESLGVSRESSSMSRTVVRRGPLLSMGGAWGAGLRTSVPLVPFRNPSSFAMKNANPAEFISRNQLEWRVEQGGVYLRNTGSALVEVDGELVAKGQDRRLRHGVTRVGIRIDRRSAASAPEDVHRQIGLRADVRRWSGEPACGAVLPGDWATLAERADVRCVLITREDGLRDHERYLWVIGYARVGSEGDVDLDGPEPAELLFTEDGAWLHLRSAREIRPVAPADRRAGLIFDEGEVTVHEAGAGGGSRGAA